MNRLFTLLLTILIAQSAQSQGSSNIELLYNWTDGSFPASNDFGNVYNEVWGFVQDEREYAVIGTTWGTHIFDVTDPYNIYMADSIAGAFQGGGVVHRDYHDYAGHLYMVCDEGTGESTFQVADLSYLPDSVHVVYDEKEPLNKAHNIFIDTATGKLYAFSPKFYPSGVSTMAVFNLDHPANPVIEELYNDLGQMHDGFVRDGILFANAGMEGLFMLDVSDLENIHIIGSLTTYPDQDYNHAGWLNDDGNIYVFADERHGMALKVVDVSDPTDIDVLSTIHSGVDSNSIPHNVILKGDFAYISYYHDGLYIYDISDPTTPVLWGYYDTYSPSDHSSYRGAWGVYPHLPSGLILVSDMQYGLFVFQLNGMTAIENGAPTEQTLSVYPNPFNETVMLEWNAQSPGETTIELLDFNGRVIYSEAHSTKSGKNAVELQFKKSLAAGKYLLKATWENGESATLLVRF